MDTHAFLWFISDDRRLSPTAASFIKDRNNDIYFSAASAWEISIKSGLGRLAVKDELESFLLQQLAENGFQSLFITISHAAYIKRLPGIHKDPFDRVLIAQSLTEDMPLISNDSLMQRYKVNIIW